jgi:hypothetical protein
VALDRRKNGIKLDPVTSASYVVLAQTLQIDPVFELPLREQ